MLFISVITLQVRGIQTEIVTQIVSYDYFSALKSKMDARLSQTTDLIFLNLYASENEFPC